MVRRMNIVFSAQQKRNQLVLSLPCTLYARLVSCSVFSRTAGFDQSDKSDNPSRSVKQLNNVITTISSYSSTDFFHSYQVYLIPLGTPGNNNMATTVQAGYMSRIWNRYLTALRERPIRTKMMTSGSLYVVGDGIAQFGIEGRSFNYRQEDVEHWDVSMTSRSQPHKALISALADITADIL
jgi:hypothetical protein